MVTMRPSQITHGEPDAVADFLDEGIALMQHTPVRLPDPMAIRSALINALRRIAVLERAERERREAMGHGG